MRLGLTIAALLLSAPALASMPTTPGTPVPLVSGEVPCCNMQTKAWYKPPQVPALYVRPEVCLALSVGDPAPWGTPGAAACANQPGAPNEPKPPPPSPVKITTKVVKGVTKSWVIDCQGKKFDIMKIPESKWTDPKIDEFDKLVGEFEKLNGIRLTVIYEMEPDPKKKGKHRIKRDKAGRKIAKEIRTECTGPAGPGKGGGKSLCDFLRDLL